LNFAAFSVLRCCRCRFTRCRYRVTCRFPFTLLPVYVAPVRYRVCLLRYRVYLRYITELLRVLCVAIGCARYVAVFAEIRSLHARCVTLPLRFSAFYATFAFTCVAVRCVRYTVLLCRCTHSIYAFTLVLRCVALFTERCVTVALCVTLPCSAP